MVNRFELLGNLTHTPELRYTAKGSPYCLIRLATNRYSGGQQFSDYHAVTAWNGHAERAGDSLHLGDRVFVEGRMETAASVRHDGSREARINCVATRVLFLTARRAKATVIEPTGPEHVADVISVTGQATEQREPVEESA